MPFDGGSLIKAEAQRPEQPHSILSLSALTLRLFKGLIVGNKDGFHVDQT